MDIFIEEIVQRKKSLFDCLLIGLIIIISLLLAVVLFLSSSTFPQFATILCALIVGIFYGAYFLIGSFNVEFEYSLVNAEIDVDKIINRSRRKKIISAPIRELEAFGTIKNPDFQQYLSNPSVKKIYAGSSKTAENLFFIICPSEDSKAMLIFSPSEKIISEIAKRNPRTQLL